MTVLCYHAVQPGWDSPMALTPADFAHHCRWLARRKSVMSLSQAVENMDGTGRLPRGTTALTFDDGFRSLHAHAMPWLLRFRLPATVFLVAQTLTAQGRHVDWVDDPPPYELETLTLDQVHEMQSAGITFESHSWSHADLTKLSFRECVRDLRESRELLEELLGRPVRMLAYPRGRHNATVRAAAELAGYRHAFTLPEVREPVGPYSLPRVGLYPGNGVGTLRVKSARQYLPLRTAAAYDTARRVRQSAARRAG